MPNETPLRFLGFKVLCAWVLHTWADRGAKLKFLHLMKKLDQAACAKSKGLRLKLLCAMNYTGIG